MDKKAELINRITAGHRKVNDLTDLLDAVPPGSRRDDLSAKLVRMFFNLAAFENGFIQLYPDSCLFQIDRGCRNLNKGCYPCYNCSSGLNAVFGKQDKLL